MDVVGVWLGVGMGVNNGVGFYLEFGFEKSL
jgi:hypothetical protein